MNEPAGLSRRDQLGGSFALILSERFNEWNDKSIKNPRRFSGRGPPSHDGTGRTVRTSFPVGGKAKAEKHDRPRTHNENDWNKTKVTRTSVDNDPLTGPGFPDAHRLVEAARGDAGTAAIQRDDVHG